MSDSNSVLSIIWLLFTCLPVVFSAPVPSDQTLNLTVSHGQTDMNETNKNLTGRFLGILNPGHVIDMGMKIMDVHNAVYNTVTGVANRTLNEVTNVGTKIKKVGGALIRGNFSKAANEVFKDPAEYEKEEAERKRRKEAISSTTTTERTDPPEKLDYEYSPPPSTNSANGGESAAAEAEETTAADAAEQSEEEPNEYGEIAGRWFGKGHSKHKSPRTHRSKLKGRSGQLGIKVQSSGSFPDFSSIFSMLTNGVFSFIPKLFTLPFVIMPFLG